MATTINAANISIGMDITKLKEGMGASRTEITQLRSILKESIDPVDKLKQQMTLLDRAFESGAIDVQQYNRSLDHLKTKLAEVNEKANAPGLSGLLKGQLGKMAGVAAGAFTVSKIFGDVEKIDSINDKAEQLGISFQDLMIVGRSFEESGGLSFDQAGQALSKMQVNLANARDKGGDLDLMLRRIGLSSSELANMNAVQAFQKINTSFSQIATQADRMQFATELFGKAGIDMVPALQISAEKFAEMEKHLAGAGLLAADMPSKMGQVSDEVKRMNDMLTGMAPEIVTFFKPLFEDFKAFFDGMKQLRTSLSRDDLFSNDVLGTAKLGIQFNTDEWNAMTKEQRAFAEDAAAKAKVRFAQEKVEQERQAKEKERIERELIEEQNRVLEKMDKAKETIQKNADQQKLIDKLSNDIDNNLVKMTERDMASLESERQRLLGAGNQNVAATVAPAIKAGTVEAYKFMNKQNEDRIARQEQVQRLEDIREELRKLNSERAVILSRIR